MTRQQTTQEQTMTGYRVQITEIPGHQLGATTTLDAPRFLVCFKSVQVRGLGRVNRPEFAMTAGESRSWVTPEAAQRNADRLYAQGYRAAVVDA